MNKSFIISIMMILTLIAASSIALAIKNIDVECQANGFAFGVAKYALVDSAYQADPESDANYKVSVTGDAQGASWTSSQNYIDGVLKNGQTPALSGGYSGNVAGDISYLTFCGYNHGTRSVSTPVGSQSVTYDGVPEFSLLTLAIAVIGVGLGLAVLRKH